MLSVIDVELLDDSAGLGLDFNFGDGLDLAGGDDALGKISLLDLCELGGIDLGAAGLGRDKHANDDEKS